MTGEVTVTLETVMSAEAAERLIAGGNAGLAETRTFPGFREVRILRHQDDPCRFLFVQRWESVEAYRSYIQWRTDRGEFQALEATTIHAETNVWPHVVASAKALAGEE